ncbi:GTP cyclohydrolase II [Paenibacillus wynnii]|uniref:GTP cyclohydrolase II n=1 Tax=Paenibacillus wynnii TaxID=268407 RepID=UPI0027933E9E|nr:GTP cyclohydrolase II [Paenibacillus wynnii]MDQ0193755.1 GTP cyclohydrolase II [Paenibacillus wynnii]
MSQINEQIEFLQHEENERLTIKMPTTYGDFNLLAIDDGWPNCTVMLFKGDLKSVSAPLIRLHSECLTGDVFGSERCDCGEQLHHAMQMIAQEETGAILYLRQEGRGIGLFNKMRAYKLQEAGCDTVDANLKLGLPEDARDYKGAADLLKSLGVDSIRLITNNPLKIQSIEDHGIKVVERVSIEAIPGVFNQQYLHTKKERMGHILTFTGGANK